MRFLNLECGDLAPLSSARKTPALPDQRPHQKSNNPAANQPSGCADEETPHFLVPDCCIAGCTGLRPRRRRSGRTQLAWWKSSGRRDRRQLGPAVAERQGDKGADIFAVECGRKTAPAAIVAARVLAAWI